MFVRHKLSFSLYRQGKYREAEESYRHILESRKEMYSTDYSGKFSTRYMLGMSTFNQERYREAEEIFRQSIQEREQGLGPNAVQTTESTFWLSRSLCEQKRYEEAEGLLRQVTRVQKTLSVVGTDETFSTLEFLAHVLLAQGKHQEAETQLREDLVDLESSFGNEGLPTLVCKSLIARTLHRQGQYQQAGVIFSDISQIRERVLGRDHVDTLHSRYCLAASFSALGKNQEAQDIFSDVAQRQERVFGKDYSETLLNKYWLGRTFYDLRKYQEAQDILSEVAQRQERIFSKDHLETQHSTYWLGRAFDCLGKHQEAQDIFGDLAKRQEVELGKYHIDTLDTRCWLAGTFYNLRRYQEAQDIVVQVLKLSHDSLGDEHSFTQGSIKLLQKIEKKSVDTKEVEASVLVDTATILTSRLESFFPIDSSSRNSYNDSEILEIATLLKQINPRWSRVPRTYIVLRSIDCLHLLDHVIGLGFSDYWFPVSDRSIPDRLSPKERSLFMGAQKLIVTKSIDLEKGQHHHFSNEEPIPFERKAFLGRGGFGEVDKVMSLISFKEYARKRVHRRAIIGQRGSDAWKMLIDEIEMLKKIEKHRHIVEFIGSYTDRKYLAMIMSPIAEMDLSKYLRSATSQQHAEIRTFFGCLATALSFLHDNQIRHKDIAPGNILIHQGNILFTDFGLAFDFTDASCSTTVGPTSLNPKYCAPEVALHQPRNTSSDIWGLGLVFLEMIAVLKRNSVDWMYTYLQEHGSRETYVRSNLPGLQDLFAELKTLGILSGNIALDWARQMLQGDPNLRPRSAELVTAITNQRSNQDGGGVFCGICCAWGDDDNSDTSEEDEDFCYVTA